VGRDPSTIQRTITIPLVLGETEAEAKAALETVDPARRPLSPAGTPEMAADYVRRYVNGGFDSFIFRTVMPTTAHAIELAAEVKRLLQ
jgi:alkanesulfonate monooxygenase SsuD/methylene tetrahydromethanopterin reductase-like flavin-dependent oxidoreductase (luciferase family)